MADMNLMDLVPTAIALFAVFVIVGTGVLIMDKYSANIYTGGSITNESVKFATNGSTVVLNYDKGDGRNTLLVATVKNKSGATAVNSSWVSLSPTVGGVVFTDYSPNSTGCINSLLCYVTYSYKNGSGTVNDVLDAGSSGLGNINDTWGSLLVTIIILMVVLTLVIGGVYALVTKR